MTLTCHEFLCIEVYKTLNSGNPNFMKDLFKLRKTSQSIHDAYKMNFYIPRTTQMTFGAKSLRTYGPNIWNTSLFLIKSSESLE